MLFSSSFSFLDIYMDKKLCNNLHFSQQHHHHDIYRLARETDIAVYYEIYVVYCRCHYENFIVWSDQNFIAKHSLLCDKSWSYTLLMQI